MQSPRYLPLILNATRDCFVLVEPNSCRLIQPRYTPFLMLVLGIGQLQYYGQDNHTYYNPPSI